MLRQVKGYRRVSNPTREDSAVKTEKGLDTFREDIAKEHSP